MSDNAPTTPRETLAQVLAELRAEAPFIAHVIREQRDFHQNLREKQRAHDQVRNAAVVSGTLADLRHWRESWLELNEALKMPIGSSQRAWDANKLLNDFDRRVRSAVLHEACPDLAQLLEPIASSNAWASAAGLPDTPPDKPIPTP